MTTTDYGPIRTIVDPGPTGMGTAFAKLDETQRKFVVALMELGNNDHTQACILAGYTGTPNALRTRASRLFHNPMVQAALHELSMEQLGGAKPMLTSELLHIAFSSKNENTKLRAIEAAMNRIGMHAISETHVKTEDISGSREVLEQRLREKLRTNPDFIKSLPPSLKQLAGPVETDIADAEFVEVGTKEEWE